MIKNKISHDFEQLKIKLYLNCFSEYFILTMSHIGYKTCGYYIVTVEILGETNEYRSDICDKNMDKFRTSVRKYYQ